jgi:deoxyribodipyrimidine photo-lyase
MKTKALCWLRRDLRLHDHAALHAALETHDEVYIAFIFDNDILDPLKKRAPGDTRVQFIAESLVEIQSTLRTHNSGIHIRYGNPVIEIPSLVSALGIDAVYFNRDYTTYPVNRDRSVQEKLETMGCSVHSFKDHVMFEPHEILKKDGTPYHVFTPYSHAWRLALETTEAEPYPITLRNLGPAKDSPANSLATLLAFAGFSDCSSIGPNTTLENQKLYLRGGTLAGQKQLADFKSLISNYEVARDFPHLDQTSKLSVYIRHGCISIRDMLKLALAGTTIGHEKWLTELIWREFYQMIFWHYPEVHTEAFQTKFKGLKFPTDEELLAKWKAGQTGFPLVDAAMRCLNQTGWMHNRLRMVVASFFSKIMLLDWKRGERYFSWKLLDYELASNNGGWQWSAGIGCDAAPYFRIFNPTLQSQKYDPHGTFIKTYCPELKNLSAKQVHNPSEAKDLPMGFRLGIDYPRPIVDYKSQRQKALDLYRNYSPTDQSVLDAS